MSGAWWPLRVCAACDKQPLRSKAPQAAVAPGRSLPDTLGSAQSGPAGQAAPSPAHTERKFMATIKQAYLEPEREETHGHVSSQAIVTTTGTQPGDRANTVPEAFSVPSWIARPRGGNAHCVCLLNGC